jgi:hypothetical protein
MASMEPTEALTSDQAAQKMPPSAQKDLLEWSSGQSPADYLALTITNEFNPSELSRNDSRIVIDDDHPFNEYFLLRACHLLHF